MNNTIKMPGVGYMISSQTPSHPYQIRPDLWNLDKGPRAFFNGTVLSYVNEGINQFLFHRPFGEQVIGDANQDYDSLATMLESADPHARDYTQLMLREIINFFIKHPHTQPSIYIGSMITPKVQVLREAGHISNWSKRISSAILPFEQSNIKFNYVFDFASGFDPDSPEWYAWTLLHAMMPNRIEMEATPHPDKPDQWGMPSWIVEDIWQRRKDTYVDGQLGKVTRWITGPQELNEYWPQQSGGIVGFILDCHIRGHICFISDNMERHFGMTIPEARDQAQRILNSKT